jgi:hypothetical protein
MLIPFIVCSLVMILGIVTGMFIMKTNVDNKNYQSLKNQIQGIQEQTIGINKNLNNIGASIENSFIILKEYLNNPNNLIQETKQINWENVKEFTQKSIKADVNKIIIIKQVRQKTEMDLLSAKSYVEGMKENLKNSYNNIRL